MSEDRYEMEAARILAEMGVCATDSHALMQSRRLLAEALARAEQRGRQARGRQKESSG